MKRISLILTAAAAMLALGACTEKPQTLDSGVKVDTQPFQGTGMAYATSGWKQGDKASWEQHMKVRTQNGQNDYTRVN
jgi:hypothetical protein